MPGRTRHSRMMRPALIALSLLISSSAIGWDGIETGTGNSIEIERGQTVREGHEIEIYDYGSEGYRSVDIDSVRRSGGAVEIEGTDHSGNAVTLEMDGD